MITIIFGALIGLVYSLIQTIRDKYNDFIEHLMMGIIRAIIGAFVGVCIAFALPMDLTTEKWYLELESLQDNNSASGSFFLGSGMINGKFQYVCYIKNNDMYEMMQVDHQVARIKYVENAARIEVTRVIPTKSFINLFAADRDLCYMSYVFEVPQGTIKNNFNLDAQ